MKLVSLQITNLFSYEKADIDFTQYPSGIILIEGINEDNADKSNGTGKSSIFEVINWVLFDDTIKEGMLKDKDKIIRSGDKIKKGHATLDFSYGKDVYTIHKIRSKGKTTINILLNGVDLEIKNVTEGKRYIESLIGLSFAVWKNSVVMGQNAFSLLFTGSEKDKSDLLGGILDFEILDKCLAHIRKNIIKDLKEEIASLKVHRSGIVSIIDDNKLLDNEVMEPNYLIKLENSNLENKKNLKYIDEKIRERDEAKRNRESIREKEEEVKIIESGIEVRKEKYKKMLEEVEVERKNVISIRDSKKLIDTEEIKELIVESKKLDKYKEIRESNKKLRERKAQLDNKGFKCNEYIANKNGVIQSKTKEIGKLKELKVEKGSVCNSCGQVITEKCVDDINRNIKELIDERSILIVRVNEAKSLLGKINKEVISINSEIDNEIEEKILKVERVKEDIKRIERKIEKDFLDSRDRDEYLLKNLERNVLQYKERYTEDSNKLLKLKSLLSSSVKVKFDKEEYESLIAQCNDTKSKINSISQRILEVKHRLKVLSDSNKKLIELDEQIAIKEQEESKVRNAEEVFSKNGIRLYLINKVAPIIEENINSYLVDLDKSNIEVRLFCEGTFDIRIYVDGKERALNLFSGGESKLISILFYLSMSDIILQRGIGLDWQIFDESTDNLDADNTVLLVDLLDNIARKFKRKIFMITHSTFARDLIESRKVGSISVTKKNGVSTIL